MVAIATLVILGLGAFGLYRLGSFLYDQDPLQQADAILVLAGTRMERALEAADLYSAGWATKIVLTEDMPDRGMVALESRGLQFPTNAETARDALMRLGIPSYAIIIPPKTHDSTAEEAQTYARLAREQGWRRIIIVTSKYHTRRARLAARRALHDSHVVVLMRGSRYDASDPPHWWRTRAGIRWTASEAQKLIVYALGLGM